jgi:hypothetical protein
MPCVITLIALFFPRVLLAFIWILTDWFSQAFGTFIWPFLGFIFMPYTTLVYMAAMLNNHHSVSGLWIVLLILAVLMDLGSDGSAVAHTRRE